ncbi:MAG TPA: 50S ribosomal protein L25 [Candidatus Limnocylindrales bacterium]
MSAPSVLTATRRTETGKSVSHLRKAGRLPAVVFGHGLASISVSLDAHEFEHVRRAAHSNTIIELKIDGKDVHRVLVHGVQVDPRTRHMLHVDLFELKSGEEVTVEIPLHTIGESYAVERLGGTLLHNVDRVKVRALPEKLPEALEYSIEPLKDFDVAIHLRDLPLPAGITLLSDPDEVVAKVAAPHVIEEPVAVEAAAEEPAEAEAESKTEE